MERLTIYFLIGRLLIFLIQKSPYPKFIGKIRWIGGFLGELISCDLCLGVWVYFGLALIMNMNILDSIQIMYISEFITGCVVSFIGHLLVIGWREKFSTFIINQE